MTLLGLRFWSPVSVVASLGTMVLGIAPLVLGGLALGQGLLGGLFGHKKAKQQEDADYQAQLDRNNQIMARARGGAGRAKFLGSIMKAYGMDNILGPDYFSDQNIMNRSLDRLGYSQPVRHKAGGPGWLETLAGAGLQGVGTYFGAQEAQDDESKKAQFQNSVIDRLGRNPEDRSGSAGYGPYKSSYGGGYDPSSIDPWKYGD